MPNPRSVSLPATQGNAAPYFANYVADQLVRRVEHATVSFGASAPQDDMAIVAVSVAR